MKRLIKAGSQDVSLDVFIQDSSSTTGAGLPGLVYNSAGLVCYYRRGATGSATQLALVTQTVGGAHADGGFVELSSANMPGMYRLDLSDAILLAGVPYVSLMLKGAANMVPLNIEIQLEQVPADMTHVGGDGTRLTRWSSALDEMFIGTVEATPFAPTTTAFECSDVTEDSANRFRGYAFKVLTGNAAGAKGFVLDYSLQSGQGRFQVTPLDLAPADGDTVLFF